MINEFLKDIDNLYINWSNFSDFKKLDKLDNYKLEINTLNELLGESETVIDDKLIEIVTNNPKAIDILLLLIAVRPSKIKNINIDSPYSRGNAYEKLQEINSNELLYFFENSGLKTLFINRFVNDLTDYLKGIEIGLDSNGRKNRNGTLMELKSETLIDKWCKDNNLTYYKQVKLKKFKEDTLIDKKFDFLIVLEEGFIAIEVNNYNSNGSKIKAISEEYIELNNALREENIQFVWITNGLAWTKNKKQLSRNLENIDNLINLKMLQDNYLDKLI